MGCEDEDEDENDDSIGGLGRRIRKLSSRTIEFCDSIDNIQVWSLFEILIWFLPHHSLGVRIKRRK